jgi:hypothetical protein
MRLMLRFFAYLLLAAGFAVLVIDATRFIESDKLVLTPLDQAGVVLVSMKPVAFETFVKDHVPEFLWDPVCLWVLRLPAFLVLAAIALVLFRLARQRPRGLGFHMR